MSVDVRTAGTARPTFGEAAIRFDLDRLYVEKSGPETGPPVLLLHGWGSSARLMQPIAAALADAYRVFNVDLPGHGKTPEPAEPWGVPEYAALVARFVEANDLAPVTLVGHSNGGRISLFLATEPATSALVRRLVLVSPSGVTPLRSWKYHLRRNTARALKAPFTILPGPIRDYCLEWLRHTLLWKALSSSDYQNVQGVMRETFVRTVGFHLDERLSRVAVPTLLLWGEHDADISRHQMDVLAREIPDAGLVVLKGSGHYGYLDDPHTFRAAVRYFLEHT